GDTAGEFDGLSAVVKVDLRILTDIHVQDRRKEFDIGEAEFAKAGAGLQKFVRDHVKVLMEAKIVLDHAAKCLRYYGQPPIEVMQIHGLGLYIYRLTIRSPGLYVATTLAKLDLPTFVRKLSDLRSFVEALLDLKMHSVELKQILEDAKQQERKSSMALMIESGSQKQDTLLSIVMWIKDIWVPPRPIAHCRPFLSTFIIRPEIYASLSYMSYIWI
ncbi:hypothetical protein DFQ28_000413, partial [Apophysomyces sp. BC1034]